jgi:hypothetical protein
MENSKWLENEEKEEVKKLHEDVQTRHLRQRRIRKLWKENEEMEARIKKKVPLSRSIAESKRSEGNDFDADDITETSSLSNNEVQFDLESNWSKKHLYRLRRALLLFGYGRWEKISQHVFTRAKASLEEIQTLSDNLVSHICNVMPQDEITLLLDSFNDLTKEMWFLYSKYPLKTVDNFFEEAYPCVRYALHEAEMKSYKELFDYIISSRNYDPGEKIVRLQNVSFTEPPWILHFNETPQPKTFHNNNTTDINSNDKLIDEHSGIGIGRQEQNSINSTPSTVEMVPTQKVTITITPNSRVQLNQFNLALLKALTDSKAYFLIVSVSNARKKETIIRRIPVFLQYSTNEYISFCNAENGSTNNQTYVVNLTVPGFIGTYQIELRNYLVLFACAYSA